MREWIATAAFGLEGVVADELRRLGYDDVKAQQTGGVSFMAEPANAFRANLWLRAADRILMVAGRFEARSFEELFEATKALPWENWIPKDGAFPIRAKCARSQLMSPSDCQSIVKKAIVERLKIAYKTDWFEETGAVYAVDVSVHSDVVTLTLDSTGEALSRRGYRTWNGEAPLRETLAAAILMISPWRKWLPMHDPCCGTGTILIEAAFIALDRAPGLTRTFACEQWNMMPKDEINAIRQEAKEKFASHDGEEIKISGADLDAEPLKLAAKHIAQAGLTGRIAIERRDVRECNRADEKGVFVTNPPYGERMGDRKVAEAVCKQLRLLKDRHHGWAVCAITSDTSFEKTFARRADKKRRLYNGRIECEVMQFYADDDKRK